MSGALTLLLMLIRDTIQKINDCDSIMAEFFVLDLPFAINTIIVRPSQVEFNMHCDTPGLDNFIYSPQWPVRTNYVATA